MEEVVEVVLVEVELMMLVVEAQEVEVVEVVYYYCLVSQCCGRCSVLQTEEIFCQMIFSVPLNIS